MATTATPGSVTNPHLKDPDAVLDYYEDWTDFLIPIADTISSVEFFFPDPACTLDIDPAHPAPLNNGLIATIWLIGGRPKKTEKCTLRIHTVDGRTDDRTMYFSVGDK